MWCLKLGVNSIFFIELGKNISECFRTFYFISIIYFGQNIQKCLAGTLSHLPVWQNTVQQFCSIYVHVLPRSKREDVWRSPSYLCITFTRILSIKKSAPCHKDIAPDSHFFTTKLNDPKGAGNLVQGAKMQLFPGVSSGLLPASLAVTEVAERMCLHLGAKFKGLMARSKGSY